MSSIVYSGGTIVNTTFTCAAGTRAEIVAGLGPILVSAGWSSLGSGLYKSATTVTPKGNSIRMRLLDPGSGNCAQIKLENDSGTKVSGAAWLLPGVGKIYRVIACQYNFFVFTPGNSSAREFVCGGTLFIPDFLNGIVVGSFGWLQGNADTDSSSSIRKSFRTKLGTQNEALSARQSFLRNDILLDFVQINSVANQNLVVQASGYTDLPNSSYRWSDDSVGVTEAILCSGISASTDESKRQGIMHNCMIVSDSFPADTVPSSAYDGHNWWAITDGNVGSGSDAKGTLFVATN